MAHYNTAQQELIGILLPGLLIEHRNIARHSTAQHCTAQHTQKRKQINMHRLRPRHDTQIDRSRICYVCTAIFAWQSNQRCQHGSTAALCTRYEDKTYRQAAKRCLKKVSTATRNAEAVSTAALRKKDNRRLYIVLYYISFHTSYHVLYCISYFIYHICI